MKALIEVERKLMHKENEEARAAKQAAREEFSKAAMEYVLENWDALKPSLQTDVWSSSASVCIKLRPGKNGDEDANVQMPPHLKKLHQKWEDIEETPNGYWNPDRVSDRDIRKRIEDKLKRVNASAVINGANCAPVERTPVVKEYLEEFLASLTKASKAAERLAA